MGGNTQHNPRVSVIMPAYNDLRFIDAAVTSILGQTYGDLELIIVDDGAGQPEVFSQLAALDRRVRIVTCEQNIGNAAAANRGIDESRGEILARLDADDIAEPHRLEHLIALFNSDPNVGLVGSWARWMSEDGVPLGLWHWPVADLEIRWTILFQSPICHPSSAFRRSAFDRAGGYNPAMRQGADHDLWWRMLEHCRAQSIPEPLVRVRRNPRSLSAKNPPNWRERTEPPRRRAWARLGVEYDADLIPHLVEIITDGYISDPVRRLPAHRTVLKLLDSFLSAQPPLRDDDFVAARQIKLAIVRRLLADRAILYADQLRLWPLSLRLSPGAALAGLFKSTARRGGARLNRRLSPPASV
jgi:glycosyltransferase involved in cell wall biosynthesis